MSQLTISTFESVKLQNRSVVVSLVVHREFSTKVPLLVHPKTLRECCCAPPPCPDAVNNHRKGHVIILNDTTS